MNYHIKLFVLFIVPFLLLPGCAKEEAPKKEVVRPIKAIQVGGLEVLTGRTFPGKAKATQEANLSFRVNGTLNQFPVKVGDEVKKGELLFTLYSPDLISALVVNDRILFASDNVMPVPTVFDGDFNDLVTTLEFMLELNLDSLVRGHGDVILRGEVQTLTK